MYVLHVTLVTIPSAATPVMTARENAGLVRVARGGMAAEGMS
jgi:hypothetical protein